MIMPPPVTHQLKLLDTFADPVLNGSKTFELRFNDRGFQCGDFIRFTVTNKAGQIDHDLNTHLFKITYVLNGYGLKEGYVALGIRDVTPEVQHEGN